MWQYSYANKKITIQNKLAISVFWLGILCGVTGMLHGSQQVDDAFGPMMVLETTGPKNPQQEVKLFKPKTAKRKRFEPQTAFEQEFYKTMDDMNNPDYLGPVLKSGESSQQDLAELRRAAMEMQHPNHPCAVPVECDREEHRGSPVDRLTTLPWNPANGIVQSMAIGEGVIDCLSVEPVTLEGQTQISLYPDSQSRTGENPPVSEVQETRTCCESLWAILSCQRCRK